MQEMTAKAVKPNNKGHKRPEKELHMGKKHLADVTVSRVDFHSDSTIKFDWKKWTVAAALGVAIQIAPLP
jgi:hypothetical protein